MFKLLKRLLFALLLLIILVVVGRNYLLAWSLPALIKAQTGFPSSIDRVDLRLTQPLIVLHDVVLNNPSNHFREPVAIRVHRLEIHYRPLSLIYGETHLTRLFLEISELSVVRDLQGETNLQYFQKNTSSPHSTSSRSTNSTPVPFRLDEFVLSMNEIRYVDESKSAPSPTLIKPNVHQALYKNLTSPHEIQKIIVEIFVKNFPAAPSNIKPPVIKKPSTNSRNSKTQYSTIDNHQ